MKHGFVQNLIAISTLTAVLAGSAAAQESQSQLLQQHASAGATCDSSLGQECPEGIRKIGSNDSLPDTDSDSTSGSLEASTPATLLKRVSPTRPRTKFDAQALPARQKPEAETPALVPDPPTDFQRFVLTSTGVELPIFGSWLFEHVPSTFAPTDYAPVPPDHIVGPGDEIELEVWGQINVHEQLTVDRAGDVFIPQVGKLSVVGLKFAELPAFLRTGIGRVFRNFELSVNIGQLRSIQVFVMGNARRPGTYTISSLSTLVNALFVSGGPTSRGTMRDIEVKRSGKLVTRLDLYDLLLRGDKANDITLQPGDIIFIPQAGPRVAVSGSVGNPAIYEISPGSMLKEVLEYAGGMNVLAAGQHITLQRIADRAGLASMNIDVTDDGLCTPLRDGDIVGLQQVVPKFDTTVSLKGNVADPVRLPWHQNMKISELIPSKDSLVTRHYWTEHNRLSTQSLKYRDVAMNTTHSESLAATVAGDKGAAIRKFDTQNDVQPPAPDINWNYAVIERLDAASLSTHLVPFNLGKVVLDHDAQSDLSLEPGDVVTVFSIADFVAPRAEQTRFVRLEGEVRMAGIYSVQPGETLPDLVKRAGGFTEKAYLFGAEFTRESTRKEQEKRYNQYLNQLEREIDQSATTLASRATSAVQEEAMRSSLASQRTAVEQLRNTPASGRIVLNLQPESTGTDALPSLPLENGDRLLVPSRPDTVSIVGTVYNQSTFLFNDGVTVHQCLEQAGGANHFADRSHMFIMRADGSVLSRAPHGHFESMAMSPGDTLVVPTNVTKTSRARGLLDWSQVISNFGIGAAAINVLK